MKYLPEKNSLPFVGLVALLLLGFVGLSWADFPRRDHDTKQILRLCTGHAVNNVHYHAQLSIVIDGSAYAIPANIGISGSCIHPVHTHDTSGTVHLDYPKKYPFTVADFFSTWGVVFSKDQLASMHAYDGYTLTMLVNGKSVSQFEKYVFQNKDRIEIVLNKRS